MDPRAFAAADRLLRVRPRSESELRQRLRQKGFEAPVIDAVVQQLTRTGALNDRAFAQFVTTSRLLSKPRGLRAIREELRRRGVAAEAAESALTQATADYDEPAAAREVAQRRYRQLTGLPASAVQRRLLGLLQRRGFSGDVAYRVVRELTSNQQRATSNGFSE